MGKTGEPYGITACLVVFASRQCLVVLIPLLESGRIDITVDGAFALPLETVDDSEPLPADGPVAEERMRVLTNPRSYIIHLTSYIVYLVNITQSEPRGILHVRQLPACRFEDDTHTEGRHRLLFDLFLCRITAHVMSHLPVELSLLCHTVIILDKSDDLVNTHQFALGTSQAAENTELHIVSHQSAEKFLLILVDDVVQLLTVFHPESPEIRPALYRGDGTDDLSVVFFTQLVSMLLREIFAVDIESLADFTLQSCLIFSSDLFQEASCHQCGNFLFPNFYFCHNLLFI